MRHELVSRIIKAYETYDQQRQSKEKESHEKRKYYGKIKG